MGLRHRGCRYGGYPENNRRAFRDWELQHRCLRDVSDCELGIDLLGLNLAAPVLLAPIGAQSVFHEDAERGVALAAAATGVSPFFNTSTTISLETLAEQVADVNAWFQLYFSRDRELTASMVARAEEAGYDAIVVTVDTPTVGWRYRDRQNHFFPPVDGDPHTFANFFSDPIFRDRLNEPPEADPEDEFYEVASIFPDPTVTWEDLGFLREHTSLPILGLGLLTAPVPTQAAIFVAGALVLAADVRKIDIATLVRG